MTINLCHHSQNRQKKPRQHLLFPSSRLLSLLPFFCLVAPLMAGAWTPAKGFTYLKFSANIFESYANFDIDGHRQEPFADSPDEFSRFRDENLSLYFETGLTNRLALFGSLVYKDIEQRTRIKVLPEDVTATNHGFADLDIGVRYRLTEGPNIWSVSLLAKLPYLYDDNDFFKLGNGQEDLEARVLFGRGLGSHFYMGLETAYRWRLEEPADEYRYLVELGYTAPKYFYARIKYDGIESRGTFQPTSGLSNPLLNPQFDLTNLAISAGIQITPTWGMEYTFSDTLAGKNTAEGSNHQYALVLTF